MIVSQCDDEFDRYFADRVRRNYLPRRNTNSNLLSPKHATEGRGVWFQFRFTMSSSKPACCWNNRASVESNPILSELGED